jgi:uncharacterized protein
LKVKPFIGFIIMLGACLSPFAFGMPPLKTQCIRIDDRTYQVEVAATPEQQQRGMQFRTRVDSKEGMIFPYEHPQTLTFWMKDCKIPLDLLYFRQGVLVHYVDSAPPCPASVEKCPVYSSPGSADTVVELKAGTRKKRHFTQGQSRLTVCMPEELKGDSLP